MLVTFSGMGIPTHRDMHDGARVAMDAVGAPWAIPTVVVNRASC